MDEAEILQQNHYYPFGMNMEGAWAGGTNRYQYNGKVMAVGADITDPKNGGLGMEHISDFGLDVNFATFRTFDPAIGRFWQKDPFAEKFTSWTPYKFGLDNPFLYADPNGDCETCKKLLKATVAYVSGAANAVASNMTGNLPGTRGNPSDFGEYADYASSGQTAGDVLSVAIGAGEMVLSVAGLIGEGVAAVPSGGTSTLAMAPTAALGVHGGVTALSGARNLMNGNSDGDNGSKRGKRAKETDDANEQYEGLKEYQDKAKKERPSNKEGDWEGSKRPHQKAVESDKKSKDRANHQNKRTRIDHDDD